MFTRRNGHVLDKSFDFCDLVREVDVNHNYLDYRVIFCHDPLSQLAIDVSSHMKLMRTRTDSPRLD